MDFYFDDYEIRSDTRELLYKDSSKKVEPLIFKLLIYMLENPDRVLTRDELINSIWESRVISDSALSAAICATRQAIGDTASKQKYIKTVSGSGYRFIAEFTKHSNKKPKNKKNSIDIQDKSHPDKPSSSLVLPGKPSVAVMNFVNIGSNEEDELLAYGLTAEINSSLARLPHFFVIARASASILSKLNLSSKEVGERLGVRYLVYGNLQKIAKRVRVILSIVDASHDAEIWSEHFDYSLDDLFLAQEEITNVIVNATDLAIEQAEIERSFLIPTEDLSAWGNYHRGLRYFDQANDVELAQTFFKKAIVQDPRFSRAYAGLSYTQTSRRILEASPISKTDADLLKAVDYSQKSIDYSPNDALGYMSLGRATLFSNRVKEAIPFFDQSIYLCANMANSYSMKAQLMSRLGRDYNQSNQLIDKAERLNPQSNANLFTTKMVRAVLMIGQGKYSEAATFSKQATLYNDTYFSIYALAAACQQLAGNPKKAQEYAKKTLELLPGCTVGSCSRLFHNDEKIRTLFIKALRDAGIPKDN